MDVREWLETAADRAPPEPSSDPKVQDTFPNVHHQPQRVSHHYRRKRKEADSDSSILVPDRRKDRYSATSSLRTASSHGDRHARRAGSRSRSFSKPRSFSSEEHREHTQRYERRPRHKTRPDRYEHKPKKREAKRKSRKGQAPQRRKSNRAHDGSRTRGLVQSFQLRNGSKNNRLTLRADASAGLFKHGRASAQVSGKGKGLPDLAFNELKFLQRPKEHQDDGHDSQARRQSKKNDRKRHLDEEISTYFTAQREAPKRIRDQRNSPAKKRKSAVCHNESTRRQEFPSPREVVDSTEKPFIGIGGREPGHQPYSQSDASTYLPWSKSVTSQAVETRCRPEGISNRPSPSQQHKHIIEVPPSGGVHAHSATGDNNINNIDLGQWVSSRRTKGPALVEIYRAPRRSNPTRHPAKTSRTLSSSQSLPRPSVDVNDETERQKAPRDVHSYNEHTYRTSDILKILEDRFSTSCAAGRSDPKNHKPFSDKENDDPESSFSLDKLLDGLQKVKAVPAVAIEAASQDKSRDLRPLNRHSSAVPQGCKQPEEFSRSTRRLPYVQQWRPALNQASMLQQAQSRSSTSVAPPIFRPHPEGEMDRRNESRHTRYASALPRTTAGSHFYLMPEDEEMLDVLADGEPEFDSTYGNERVSDNWTDSGARFAPTDLFGEQIAQSEQEEILPWSEVQLGKSEPQRGDTHWYVGGIDGDTGMEQVPEQDDQLVGFWKPQRLY